MHHLDPAWLEQLATELQGGTGSAAASAVPKKETYPPGLHSNSVLREASGSMPLLLPHQGSDSTMSTDSVLAPCDVPVQLSYCTTECPTGMSQQLTAVKNHPTAMSQHMTNTQGRPHQLPLAGLPANANIADMQQQCGADLLLDDVLLINPSNPSAPNLL